jgi:hypothetical protein
MRCRLNSKNMAKPISSTRFQEKTRLFNIFQSSNEVRLRTTLSVLFNTFFDKVNSLFNITICKFHRCIVCLRQKPFEPSTAGKRKEGSNGHHPNEGGMIQCTSFKLNQLLFYAKLLKIAFGNYPKVKGMLSRLSCGKSIPILNFNCMSFLKWTKQL